MLRKRLAGSVVVKGGHVVQSIQYRRFLPVGSPEVTVEFLSSWGVDEILLLDMDASKHKTAPDFERLQKCSQRCFVPLTYGGGIQSIDHIRECIRLGADKVALNSVLLDNPDLLTEAAKRFGVQCLVASIDLVDQSGIRVWDHRTSTLVQRDPLEYVQALAEKGAGELLLSFVHRNGMKQGLEIDFVQKVRELVKIPLIVSGGTGHPEHVWKCFSETDVSCVAIGNFLHFSEHSVQTLKSYLARRGLEFRSDSKASYEKRDFDSQGRIAKLPDSILAELRFEIIKDEKI